MASRKRRVGGRPQPESHRAWPLGACPFGPVFFLTQLRGFVRERCPNPAEHLPALHLHVIDGEILDVCHVIGLTPTWVALAVRDEASDGTSMRSELVPYDTIVRVTILPVAAGGKHMGFDLGHAPTIVTPSPDASAEDALRMAALPAEKETRSKSR